jgi:proline iminopeptidase
MKKALVISGSLLLVAAAAGAYFWYATQQPLYRPGMVRAGTNLRAPLVTPPQARVSEYWQVEPDIRLHRFSEGIGKSVLMLHGGPGVPFTRPIAALRSLARDYEFIYYDQRGCGRSTRPFDRFASSNFYQNMTTLERTLGIGAQVADIERVRLLLVQDKLFLVGHSFGALLASMYAAEFPESVRAMVLISPANLLVMPVPNEGLFGAVRNSLPASKQPEYGDFLRSYLDFGEIFTKSESDLAGLNSRFASYYRAAATTRGFRVPEVESGEIGGWMVQALYFSMGKRHDYTSALKSIQAPVLVLHGARDLQTEAETRAFADAFPHATFRVIPEAGHFMFEDQPVQFAEAVGSFLAANARD